MYADPTETSNAKGSFKWPYVIRALSDTVLRVSPSVSHLPFSPHFFQYFLLN